MTVSIPLHAYSILLLSILAIILAAIGLSDRRRRGLLLCSLPFGLTSLACLLRMWPSLLPGNWGLQLGATLLLASYTLVWQVVRNFQLRGSVLPWVLAIPIGWLLVSVAAAELWATPGVGILAHGGAIALVNLLCARELERDRSEPLPARGLLRAVFLLFAAQAAIRLPLAGLLPMPLGILPGTAWAVLAYNGITLLQASLVTALLIILSRERAAQRGWDLASRDPLTGALNRRAYAREAERLKGQPGPVTLLVFDIDRFKSINDRFGHGFGDKVIGLAVRTGQSVLRETDALYRVGGEEFVCIMRGTPAEAGFQAAERLRSAFEFAGRRVEGVQLGATLSVGVSSKEGPADLQTLFELADRALYAAKHGGRNRSVLAAPQGKAA